MCGLVGAVGVLDHRFRTKTFRDFLDASSTRGRDSTGVIKVDNDLDYDWMKNIGAPAYLYDSRMYEKHIESGTACALIGHTRSKTIGEISHKNAHPFDFPDAGICGVHNGTLRSYHNLDTHTHQKVDSEVLYGHLAANGPENTFDRLTGAYACVWWNDKTKTVNFFRNEERPLWFAWSKDCKTMFWASEKWMFFTIERAIELYDGGAEGTKYVELPPHKLWSFRINPNAKGEEKNLIMRPVIEIKVPEKKAQTHTHTTGPMYGGGNRGGYTQGGYSAQQQQRRDPNFTKNADGSFSRIEPKHEEEVTSAQGGKVTDPFLIDRERVEGQLLLSGTHDTTKDGKKTTELSNVAFLKSSVSNMASVTVPKSGKNSGKNILSLPSKTSSRSPSSSNVERLKASISFCPGVDTTNLLKKIGVSHRVVAGMPYITDNKTGTEYVEREFLLNTNGTCCACKEPIGDITQVGDIIDDANFICEDCLLPPIKQPFGREASK